MNILLVEDEPLVAMLLTDALTHAGHTILGPVSSVSAGIREAKRKHPDLALVDIDLGKGGNGVDLARQMHERWRTPILFMSAYGDAARNASDVALGLVEKPYSPSLVLKCVNLIARVLAGCRRPKIPHGLELFRTPSPGRQDG